MAQDEGTKPPPSPSPRSYGLDAKWDACIDLTIRRVLYSSLAGAFGGLLLFRSRTSRWASFALGAGVGIGAAYTESSYIFGDSPPKWPPNVSAVVTASQVCCSFGYPDVLVPSYENYLCVNRGNAVYSGFILPT